MVKHIVMFRLKGTPEQRRDAACRFRDALNDLPTVIPCLRHMEAAVNDNPAESWDVVLTATLDSMDDVAVYAAHPAHVAAASIIAPYKDERGCVDYEL